MMFEDLILVKFILYSVPETENLERLIEKHLSPTPWNDNLTSYRKVSLSKLRFFIQKRAKVNFVVI
jgi:pyoverdine/dityrosine biosynthesis protein Dit1